jgi:hypothetical protein
VEAKLRSWKDVHPRLFLNAQALAELRNSITGTHAGIWGRIKRYADTFLRQGPPAYQETASDTEQLWQREVGNKQPFLAMAFLVTGDERYRAGAQQWALASCSYPRWGLGSYEGADLAAGHQLLGLALVYDWLYDVLDGEVRETIRGTLISRGRAMFSAASSKMYWRASYLQNHLWVNVTGLMAAALALADNPEHSAEAAEWIAGALDKMRRTDAALGPDGASHEGVAYWTYGVEYMLKFWALASTLLGEDLSSEWWAKTAAYRLYMSLPRESWSAANLIVDLADCPRYDWYGPEYLLRALAKRFQDGYAQWLAQELEAAGYTQYSAAWLNLLWYDPSVEAKPPEDLPRLRHFSDLGLVSARSDWSGAESLVVFKCGPPIGREATSRFDYDPGSGHVHPDAGHFVLFGAGDWLIRDDGYAWKQTSHHNTLLVDGRGQLGEGAQWFRGVDLIRQRLNPCILEVSASPELDLMVGDATEAYPKELGLRRFVRRLLFLKPDVLIVVDEIEAAEPRELELRFHPETAGAMAADAVFLATSKKATLRLESLTPAEVRMIAGETLARDRNGADIHRFAVRLMRHAAVWRNAVALSWSPAGQEPASVTLESDSGRWVFRVGDRTVAVDWEKAVG